MTSQSQRRTKIARDGAARSAHMCRPTLRTPPPTAPRSLMEVLATSAKAHVDRAAAYNVSSKHVDTLLRSQSRNLPACRLRKAGPNPLPQPIAVLCRKAFFFSRLCSSFADFFAIGRCFGGLACGVAWRSAHARAMQVQAQAAATEAASMPHLLRLCVLPLHLNATRDGGRSWEGGRDRGAGLRLEPSRRCTCLR